MPLYRIVFWVAALALATSPATAAHKLNTAQMVDLENRFERALIDKDAKTIQELTSDSATIVLAFARPTPPSLPDPGFYATTAILSKGELVASFVGAPPLSRTGTNFSSVDGGNRRYRVSDDGFVVTVPASEFIPTSEACASVCMPFGVQPNVYATVVWLRTHGRLRVVLLETSAVEVDLNSPFVPHISGKPIAVNSIAK
jgi:hypothetical protein